MTVTAPVVLLVMATAVAGRAAWAAARGHAVRQRFAGGDAGGARRLPPPPARVAVWIDQAGFEVAPAVAWWLWVGGLGAIVVALVAIGGPAVAILGLLAGLAATAAALRARRGRGDARLELALPGALEAIARALRSGASLRQAIGEAALGTPGRLGRELGEVARQAAQGATLVDALDNLAARRPLAGVRLAVAALCLGVETGGAQAKAVDGVAATLRDRLAVTAEVHALAAQARLSGLVIGLAPLAFGAFAVSTDPRTGRFLFHTALGLALLAAGLGLDGAGWLWMKRLTRVPL